MNTYKGLKQCLWGKIAKRTDGLVNTYKGLKLDNLELVAEIRKRFGEYL